MEFITAFLTFCCDKSTRRFHDLAVKKGATENAGVENVIQSKMQGWKMQE